MTHYRNCWIIALLPGLLSGLVWVGYAVAQPYFTGECDMKLGCTGWVQVASAMGAVSFVLSAIGIAVVAVLRRELIRQLRLRWVLVLASVLVAVLLVMFYTVGRWPVESVAHYFVLWAVIPSVVAWVVLMAMRKLAPNKLFKPTPLRGAA